MTRTGKRHAKRNACMLSSREKRGYDWWWHSFIAENPETGEEQPFFIEYFVINPGRSSDGMILGQSPESRATGQKPCYAMIKAGTWGKDKLQLNAFFPVEDFQASRRLLDVRIGQNTVTENHLSGSISVSPREAEEPGRMTDAGTMSWDLAIDGKDVYSVGYGASTLFRRLKLFTMFWHIGGMSTRYRGTVELNGQKWMVKPDTCGGYQDKNWGRDYTNPWIWLNCNRFSDSEGQSVPDASLDIGGGNPCVLGIPLGPKILVAFRYGGMLHEFNFSRIFFQKQKWHCTVTDDEVVWHVSVGNRTHTLDVDFTCPKETMLLVNYENPDGQKNHTALYNGGYAEGTLVLKRKGKRPSVVCSLKGRLGGCEYGAY